MDWSKVWVYDIETYPNFFCLVAVNYETDVRLIFEISSRRDHAQELSDFLFWCMQTGAIFVGFNNNGFDWPVMNRFMELVYDGHRPTAYDLYQKAQAIIDSDWRDYSHIIWESDMLIPQIDLYKIMHFDNHARRTSLKKLEIALRLEHVEEMPVEPARQVPIDLMDATIWYCCWDVNATKKFCSEIKDRIEFRAELDQRYGGRTRVNYNDTKIGKNHFLDILQGNGIQTKVGKDPIQTKRENGIRVCDVLLPIQFDSPTLQQTYEMFRSSIIPPANTKGFFTGVSGYARDFKLDFGTGGLHGSLHKTSIYEDDEFEIVDCDVTSMYPSIAIKHGFYPQHLGPQFVQIYADLLKERQSHKKGTAPNGMLKLALNGTYGESNNKFSSFYDPQFTMAITINGQLLLAKLMEMLLHNPAIQPIQANTDGITVKLPRSHRDWYNQICQMWSDWCLLDLEYAEYRSMHIRDVNNYIAVGTDGKVKEKGAYVTDPEWHKDQSSLVVQKAVRSLVEDGVALDWSIYQDTQYTAYDFMRSVQVQRNSRLVWGGQDQQRNSRYYIALEGAPLIKLMPPLAGNVEDRQIAIDKDWNVGMCNWSGDFEWNNLNRRWYLNEAEKLASDLGLSV